jgi:hypothetical protein
MAEATTVSVLLQAKDNVSPVLDKIQNKSRGLADSFAQHRKQIGVAAAGIGAAIAGIALVSVTSAVEQRKTIRQLDVALKTVGTSYDANKKQIEDLAAAQQKKTNFGDEESRRSLAQLITVSGDYGLSMQALVVAQDIAAGSGKSLDTVTRALARGISGEATAMKAFGLDLDAAATGHDVLAAATAMYGGQAEAAFDATIQLKQTIDDLKDAIGTSLLPVMDKTLEKLDSVVRSIVDFTEKNPGLVNTLAPLATALGVALIALGGLLLIAPGIHAMILLLTAQFGSLSLAMGPISAIVLGITAVVMAGILIYKNWDKIMAGITWTMNRAKEGIAAYLKGWLQMIIGVAKGIRAIANFIPGMKDLVGAIDSGIAKLEGMEDALDDWATTSNHAVLEVADEFSDLETSVGRDMEDIGTHATDMAQTFDGAAFLVAEAADKTAQAIKDSAKDMEEFHATIAAQIEQNALDAIHWYNEEENVHIKMTDATIARIESINDAQKTRIQGMENVTASMRDNAEFQKNIDDYLSRSLIENEEDVLMHQKQGVSEQARIAVNAANNLIEIAELKAARMAKIAEDAAAREEARLQALVDAEAAALLKRKGMEEAFRANITTAGLSASIQRMQNIPQYVQGKWVEGQGFATGVGGEYFIHGVHDKTPRTLPGTDIPNPKYGTRKINPALLDFSGIQRGGPEDVGRQHRINEYDMWLIGANRERLDLQVRMNNAYGRGPEHQGMGDRYKTQWEFIRQQIRDKREIAYAARYGGTVPMGAGGILVGERGPEVVDLPGGSRIHPGGGGQTNNFIFNGAVYGVDDLREVVVEAVRDHAISGGFSGVFAEA